MKYLCDSFEIRKYIESIAKEAHMKRDCNAKKVIFHGLTGFFLCPAGDFSHGKCHYIS